MKEKRSLFFRGIITFIVISLVLCDLRSQSAFTQENYDVKFYFLDVSVTNESTYISGVAEINVHILTSNDTLVLDFGDQLLISSLSVNGMSSSYSSEDDKLIIVSDLFVKDSDINISVEYEGDGNAAQGDGALYNETYQDYGAFTYSLTEPYSSKYWYPCKQVLSDKTDSVYVYITVPKGLKAGSNGLLKRVVAVGDDFEQYQWESQYPTAFYLISVAVGDYLDYTFNCELEGIENTLPVVNYIYNSDDYLNDQKQNIDTTDFLLKLFSELFVLYPFSEEKYGHCTAPLGGGMEHQTMTTLGSFNYTLVAHELAHQWFGNYVTCQTWNDIWINEGFASYCEYLSMEYADDIEGAQSWLEQAQSLALNSRVGSIYVPDDELYSSSRIFDYKSTYKKGASIIHMLRYEIDNDALFFEALREFLQLNAFSTASVNDLIDVLFNVTGESYEWFFEQWYYGAGYPIYKVDWYQQNDSLYIKTSQYASEPESVGLFKTKLDYKIIYPTGDTIVRTEILANEEFFSVKINKPVFNVVIDPLNALLKEVENVSRVDSLMTHSNPDILVFPNPAKDSFRIYSQLVHAYADVDIYTISGKKVKAVENVSTHGGEISIRDMAKGVYIIEVRVGDTRGVLKLIKS